MFIKFFSKIYQLYKNYEIIKNLKWTKKGIFVYIMFIITIIKSIISHPIYKITKKIINFLIILEGILLVIYYTELPIDNVSITFTTIYIFIQETILKFIRDKLDYLLDNNPFEENNQSKEIIKPNENNNSNTSNNSFYWWIGISIVIISSTIAIYYYYPNILDYFNKDKGDGSNPPSLNIDTNVNNNIIDFPNTPISITPDPNVTPKPSSTNLPPVADEIDTSVFNPPKCIQSIHFSSSFKNKKESFLRAIKND